MIVFSQRIRSAQKITIQEFSNSNQSVRELRDLSKAGWSRTQKRIALLFLGGISLKLFTQYYNTDIKFTCQPTQQNINTIKGSSTLRNVLLLGFLNFFLKGKYVPTFYLPSAFLQSLYGSLFDSVPYAPFTREYLQVDKDGGSITLDHLPINVKYLNPGGDEKENMRILIILHGLTGASECNYIRQAALFASRKGFRTICINLRGYSHSKLTTPYFTDFTNINDVKFAIEEINSRYPNSSIYALGYSMGANQLLRFLEQDIQKIIKGSVAISVPWNIHQLSQIISSPYKSIYDFAITRNFKRNLSWNSEILDNAQLQHKNEFVDIKNAQKSKFSRHYDEYLTRRMFGFDTIDEMYQQIECESSLKKITTPVLIISSKNDPIIDYRSIPKEEILNNPNLILVQTHSGSHIEWFTGFKPIRWIHKTSLEFLDYQHKSQILNNIVK